MNQITLFSLALSLAIAPSSYAGAEAHEAYINGTNDFGLKVFQKLVAKESESQKNVLYSPVSMNTALSMVGHFAGESEQKIFLKAIGVDLTFQEYTDSVVLFSEDLAASQSEEYEVVSANSFWVTDDYKILESDSLSSLKEAYKADVSNDLRFADASTADAMNKWVDEKTKGKIKDLVQPKDLIPNQWAAINAVYLDAKWYRKFGKGWKAEFTRPDGSASQTEYMEAAGVGLRKIEAEDLGATIWEIPYGKRESREAEEKKGSFVVIHPANPADIQKIASSLTGAKVAEIKTSLATEGELDRFEFVNLMLPAFDLDYETDKAPVQSALEEGGAGAFFNAFDMTALNPAFNIEKANKIKVIKQKAKITVANTGTVAAAASFVGGGIESMGPRSVFVDSAFIYLILDEVSGAVLFAGTYTDPDQAETPEMK